MRKKRSLYNIQMDASYHGEEKSGGARSTSAGGKEEHSVQKRIGLNPLATRVEDKMREKTLSNEERPGKQEEVYCLKSNQGVA